MSHGCLATQLNPPSLGHNCILLMIFCGLLNETSQPRGSLSALDQLQALGRLAVRLIVIYKRPVISWCTLKSLGSCSDAQDGCTRRALRMLQLKTKLSKMAAMDTAKSTFPQKRSGREQGPGQEYSLKIAPNCKSALPSLDYIHIAHAVPRFDLTFVSGALPAEFLDPIDDWNCQDLQDEESSFTGLHFRESEGIRCCVRVCSHCALIESRLGCKKWK